jgi:nitrate reductase NapE component
MGEWGPLEVPSTRVKKRMRWWAIVAVVLAVAAVSAYGYWMYTLLR